MSFFISLSSSSVSPIARLSAGYKSRRCVLASSPSGHAESPICVATCPIPVKSLVSRTGLSHALSNDNRSYINTYRVRGPGGGCSKNNRARSCRGKSFSILPTDLPKRGQGLESHLSQGHEGCVPRHRETAHCRHHHPPAQGTSKLAISEDAGNGLGDAPWHHALRVPSRCARRRIRSDSNRSQVEEHDCNNIMRTSYPCNTANSNCAPAIQPRDVGRVSACVWGEPSTESEECAVGHDGRLACQSVLNSEVNRVAAHLWASAIQRPRSGGFVRTPRYVVSPGGAQCVLTDRSLPLRSVSRTPGHLSDELRVRALLGGTHCLGRNHEHVPISRGWRVCMDQASQSCHRRSSHPSSA